MSKIDILQKWIDESTNIVFFGGAGVSTESGIPDFRSCDGLYSMKYEYPPEMILSHSFYIAHPEEFYRFYKEKMLYLEAVPSIPHQFLKRLEDSGKLKWIITQNIDGLHQAAGSVHVLELHGSVHRNYCERCGKFHGVSSIIESVEIPYCECGGRIKPDVVLYEEGLDPSVIDRSIQAIQDADLLIVGGTSLNVYPAAGFLDYFQGNKMVLINKSITPRDHIADLVIHDPLGEVVSSLYIK
ncbi:MAG: NAD-dependent protein deacylase [Erysipelotrichaceae bacterium]|nr:NAD-dependent protein deacylase [Erysipelotrichaceae bacterium]